MEVSINIIATNKYTDFLPGIFDSIQKFFFVDHQVTIIVHTNKNYEPFNLGKISVMFNHIEHEEWPFITLKRFHYFIQAEKIIEKSDFSFYVDVDSLFIGNIGFSDITENGIFATIHPCLNQGPGTPERNPSSEAYIPYGSTNRYFCGGFFGGSSRSFLWMSEKIKEAIDKDLTNNIVAIWHDESHLNKFLFVNEPMIIFDYPFAIAENLNPEHENSKIKFLDKKNLGGHEYLRN